MKPKSAGCVWTLNCANPQRNLTADDGFTFERLTCFRKRWKRVRRTQVVLTFRLRGFRAGSSN
ncbi:MAG: hypothetical protein ACTS5F_00580 [Candidatus Hodgkinia cicadicola]